MSHFLIGYINRYEKKSCNHRAKTRPADYKVIKCEATKDSAPGIIYLPRGVGGWDVLMFPASAKWISIGSSNLPGLRN